MPGPRTYDFQNVQSGLDAFLSGAGEGFGAIDKTLRERKVRQQQDEAHRVNVESVQAEQARKNIEAGVSVVPPDPITEARSQVSGIRAKIGALLSGGASTPRPTPTYAKTGLSEKEILANQREAGDTARTGMTNATTLEATRIREGGDMARHGETLAETKRRNDMWSRDQAADRGIRASQFNRSEAAAESRSARDYAASLTAEMTSLLRESDPRIMRMKYPDNAEYEAQLKYTQGRLDELRAERQALHATMQKRAIGQQIAPPTPAPSPSPLFQRATDPASALLRSGPRGPTLQEDLQRAMRP